MFENSERQLHQFAHGGAQGGHLGFTPSQQALVQGLDMRVIAGRDDGSHVQRRPNPRGPGFGESGPAMDTATGLTFDRNQAQERSDLIGGLKLATVQDGESSLGGFIADRRNREQQVTVLAQAGMLIDVAMEGRLQAGRFLFQEPNMLLERLRNRRRQGDYLRFFLPVPFPAQVGFDRIQAGDQGVQVPNLRGRGLPAGRVDQSPITGQHLAIAGIGFGAHRQALTKRLGLGRIDHGDRRPGVKKPERHRLMVDPGRFQNQMNLTQVRHFLPDQPIPQLRKALGGVRHGLGVALIVLRIQQTDIQFVFGDINTETVHEDSPRG